VPWESVGATVTVEPVTVTRRKWYTCASALGTGAPPQAFPLFLLYDQPIAYASVVEQWLTVVDRAPPPPVT